MFNTKFEDEYFDQLRAIEECINTYDKQIPDLVDYNVNKVLDGLIRLYTAEERGKREPKLKFNAKEQTLFDSLKQVCELLIGRDPDVKVGEEAITVSEMIACLKRILRSVNLMNDRGRRGYLEFITVFFKE